MKSTQQRLNDHGISLMEVMVSMVVLSVLLAAVANVAVHSIQNVIRSDAGVTSSTIAQDVMERLLSVPVSNWAFDEHGNIKRDKHHTMRWGDGRDYRIERRIEPVTNPYSAVDACDVIVGQGTTASDLIKVTITVLPQNNGNRDRYETVFLLSRDEKSRIAESSLTVRFNVTNGMGRRTYHESLNGGITVSLGKGTAHEQSATTRNGCVTFMGISDRKVNLSFKTRSYKETLSGVSDYNEVVHLVKGSHRIFEFDLIADREVTVVPQLDRDIQRHCQQPRLLRTRMVLDSPDNRGVYALSEIAADANQTYQQLLSIPESRRSTEQQMLIQSGSRWQYYIECRPPEDYYGRPQDSFWHLLPDSIPISLVTTRGTNQTIKPVATWADTTFKPSGYPYVEEGEWPVVAIPKAAPGETQRLMVGSCIMSRSEDQGVLVTIPAAPDRHWKHGRPPVVRLPMWSTPIDGIEQPPASLRNVQGNYSVVIKQVFDNGERGRFGDRNLRRENQRFFGGCTDAKVFHVGWLKAYDARHNNRQIRLLLPFGLYTYGFYTPDQTETNEQGVTVMKSRHSCDGNCQYAQGESQCIRSGADSYGLFEADGRTLMYNYSGRLQFSQYTDWAFRQPRYDYWNRVIFDERGPILEGCPAFQE